MDKHARWQRQVPWLRITRDDDGPVFGCSICAKALTKGGISKRILGRPGFSIWATNSARGGSKWSNVIRHKHSEGHCVAKALLRSSKFQGLQLPAESAFEKVLKSLQKRNSRAAVDGVGGSEMIKKMIWCLAEAFRAVYRRQLREAHTIALHHDKGSNRLLVRFTACTVDLGRVAGVLGLQTTNGGHREIVESLIGIIKRFCTIGGQRPKSGMEFRTGEYEEAFLDESLYEQLRSKIHFWNTDGASECQLAGRLLQQGCRSISEQGKEVFSNLQIVNWDTAHASRRVTTRPWKCDEYLNGVLQWVLLKKNSIVRIVQNSAVFRDLMRKNIQMSEGKVSDKVFNFGFAGHRFDSTTKPVGRAVHNLFALIHTAIQIERLRPNKPEGAAATDFLRGLSTERVVQLAMLADGAHEAMAITRFCDSEAMHGEDLCFQLECFVAKVSMLFLDGGCVRHGFTRWILEKLKKTPVLVYVDGRPKLVGSRTGVSAEIVDRCIGRMTCWVRLCIAVLTAEYPHFSLLSAFSVFNLPEDGTTAQDVVWGSTLRSKIERLAKHFEAWSGSVLGVSVSLGLLAHI